MPMRRRQKSCVPSCAAMSLQAVVAGDAAAELELHRARREVELVVRDQDLVGRIL